jgi:hypothetical protein
MPDLKTEALQIARDALDEIALAGMSGSGQESEEGMRDWHARRAWEFIGIAARARSAIAALAATSAPAERQNEGWWRQTQIPADEHPAATRSRERFEAEHAELSDVMVTVIRWRHTMEAFRDHINRDREVPTTEQDVDAARDQLHAAIRRHAALATSAPSEPAEPLFLIVAGGDNISTEIVPQSRLDEAYLLTQWSSLDPPDADQHREALEHFHDPGEWQYMDPLRGGEGRIATIFSLNLEGDWVSVYRLPDAHPAPSAAPAVRIFDDRPQLERLAKAEHAMRNPPKLEIEDERAQPEPKCSRCGSPTAMQCNGIGCFALEGQDDEPSAGAQTEALAEPTAVPPGCDITPEGIAQACENSFNWLMQGRKTGPCIAAPQFAEAARLLRTPPAEVVVPAELGEASRDVLAERARQVSAEGWTPGHDDEHWDGALSKAAACYALGHTGHEGRGVCYWPWGMEWWKPKDRRSNLIRAGALILAEIERLDRAKSKEKAS